MDLSVDVFDGHAQGAQIDRFGPLQPFDQALVGVVVHQETDRSPVHSENRRPLRHELVQRLQHEAVAAQGDHDIGLLGSDVVVARLEKFLRLQGFFVLRGDDGDRLEIHGGSRASFPAGLFFPTARV